MRIVEFYSRIRATHMLLTSFRFLFNLDMKSTLLLFIFQISITNLGMSYRINEGFESTERYEGSEVTNAYAHRSCKYLFFKSFHRIGVFFEVSQGMALD
jgi:hypothetical protein